MAESVAMCSKLAKCCVPLFLVFEGCSGDSEAVAWAARQNMDDLGDAGPVTCVVSPEDAGTTMGLRLNEVVIDPPGADANNEYIELAGTACESVSSTYVVSIEGDSESNPGTVDNIFDLASLCGGLACSLGADGLLVIAAVNGWSKPESSNATWLVSKGLVGGGLENGTATLLLLRCATAPAPGDWDSQNSGILQLPVGCSLLDSLTWLDRTSGDIAYSDRVVGPKPGPGAAVRCESPSGMPSWYFGSLSTGVAGISFTGVLPTNAPADALLTPGLTNHCNGIDLQDTPSGTADAGDAGTGRSNPGSGGTYSWWQDDVTGTLLDASAMADAGNIMAAGGAPSSGVRPQFPQTSCSSLPQTEVSFGWGIVVIVAVSVLRWARRARGSFTTMASRASFATRRAP